MNPIHLAASAAPPDKPDDRSFDFVASTGGVNSYDIRIAAGAWDLERYTANPVVLLDHEYELESIVGYASDVRMDGDRLLARVTLVSEETNPRAEMARRLIVDGALRAMSVGAMPLDAEMVDDVLVITKLELRELSLVPVPSDPGALRASARTDLLQLAAKSGAPKVLPMNFSKLLGLKDDADESTQASEIVRLKAGEAQLLAAAGVKSLGEAAGAIEALKLAAAAGKQAEMELAAYRESAVRAEHERTVDAALADGRLQPSQREWAIALSADVLKGFLATTQPMRTRPTETSPAGVEGLTESEIKLCAAKGWKPDEYIAAKRSNTSMQKGA